MADALYRYIAAAEIARNDLLHQQLLQFQQILAELDDVSSAAFLAAVTWLKKQFGFDESNIAHVLARDTDDVRNWVTNYRRGKIPTGEVARTYLNEICKKIAVTLSPCSPEYQYAGREIIDARWVLPADMPPGTSMAEVITRLNANDPPISAYLKKAIAAIEEEGIETVRELLSQSGWKRLSNHKGVGMRCIEELRNGLLRIGFVNIKKDNKAM